MRCSRCGGRDPGCYVCQEEETPDRTDHDHESARDAELMEDEALREESGSAAVQSSAGFHPA